MQDEYAESSTKTGRQGDKETRRKWPPIVSLLVSLSPCLLVLNSAEAQEPGPDSRPAGQTRDDELSKKLINQAVTGGANDVMVQIMDLMSDARDRLAGRLDPGEETQTVQKQIIARLDEAIQKAMQQRRRTSAPPSPGEAEKRTMPGEPKAGRNDQAEQNATGDSSPDAAQAGPTDAKTSEKLRGPLMESRRGWGHLPKRDREELLQGMNEEVIERYRSQIDQYYRALGEQEEAP